MKYIFNSFFTLIFFFLQVLFQPVMGETLQDSTKVQDTSLLAKKEVKSFPVIGKKQDTLFFIFSKTGAFTAKERASISSERIQGISTATFVKDSLSLAKEENGIDIVYKQTILLSVSERDAEINQISIDSLAKNYVEKIKANITETKESFVPDNIFLKIGFVALILLGLWLVLKMIAFFYKKFVFFIHKHKNKWLKSLSYNNYTFITPSQELTAILFVVKIFKWLLILIVVYVFFPLIFSVFEFTQGWSDYLFHLIWSSFRHIFISVWHYFPNLFSILAIIFVMHYVIKFVKYIFSEIKAEKLEIPGFHADWAMPTYSIVRFLLYAFMFVLIFPYLPGSDSSVFKGVSVFIGVLFSLGSSSAIANMIAGLVITYMRPFKIGDRVNLGNISGNVVEKTMLVTRLKTIKNEEITIPNSAVLNGNTINYSSYAEQEGLIVNTTITLGYDIPYKEVYNALIEAALKTDLIEKTPKPFVLQTSLDDFYVSYQLNAYTKQANKQAIIYSELHQHIQDSCNKNGIEILSPHYRAQRDGNTTTIPKDYLSNDYEAPSFRVTSQEKEPPSTKT